MEKTHSPSAIFIKIFAAISAVALGAVFALTFFLGDSSSAFAYVHDFFRSPFEISEFGGLLYAATLVLSSAAFLVCAIIALFIKKKENLARFYRVFVSVCGFFALLALFLEALWLARTGDGRLVALPLTPSAISFGIIWLNLLVGAILLQKNRNNALIISLKTFLLLLCLSPLFLLSQPLFVGQEIAASDALAIGINSLFPAGGNTTPLQEFLSLHLKYSFLESAAPILYTVLVGVPIVNLFLSQITLFVRNSRPFDIARYVVVFLLACLTLVSPLLLLSDVQAATSPFYFALFAIGFIGIFLSILIKPEIPKRQVIVESESAIGTVVGTPVEEVPKSETSSAANDPNGQPGVIKMTQDEFEIGKQIPSVGADGLDDTITATFVSSGIDANNCTPPFDATVPAVETDAFIASLTTEERIEFRNCFIETDAPVADRMPRYCVGGDNRLFFRRIFLYIARFRTLISPSLLEKIYLYAAEQIND